MVVDRGILMDPAGIVLDLTNNTAFVADQGAHAIYLIDMEYQSNEVSPRFSDSVVPGRVV